LRPEIPEQDNFVNESSHLLRQIKNHQRQATAILLLKALVDEDNKENNKR
jgi:hypothetical protein